MSTPIDMSSFEDQFNEGRLSNEMDNETFERVAFLRDRMAQLEESIEYRKEMISFANERAEDIRKIQQEIERLLAEVRKKSQPFDSELINLNRDLREESMKLDEANREWQRIQAELLARRRLIAERGLVDSKTEDAQWRNDAREYQLEGAHRVVAGERSILGDKPGLGKTLQSIIAIEMLRAKGKAKKVLIFTPKPVLRDYERSFKRWAKGLVFVLDTKGKGNKTMVLEMVKHMEEIVILTNYEVWRKDRSVFDAVLDCKFDTLILDECHTIKDRRSKIFEDMREIVYGANRCPKCWQDPQGEKCCAICGYWPSHVGEFCSVTNLIEMSGSTVLNRPEELWPLLNLMDRVAFPSENRYLNDFCQQRYDYHKGDWVWAFRPGGSERLLKKLGVRYTARTENSAGVEMPPQEVKHHHVELTMENYPRQYKFIKALKDKARLVFGEEQVTQLETLAWYTRMRQSASWPDVIQIKDCMHDPVCLDDAGELKCPSPEVIFPPPDAPKIGESIIMDSVEDLVHEAVSSDQRIVVFSHFNGVLDELERRMQAANIRVCKYNGSTSDKLKGEIADDFNVTQTDVGDHKYDVLLMQYKSGSVGLNLSGAHQAVFVEREWNSAKEDQAMRRIRRMDSKHQTQVHVIHAEGTATELIDTLIEAKDENLGGFESTVDMHEKMRKWLDEN